MDITEIGCMGVKPGLNVMDETTPEGQILARTYNSIAAAQSAPNSVYMGLEIENPLRIWGFFDWDSLEHHQKFAKTFGGEAVKDLPTILTHGEFTKHITFTPSLNLALQAPVTEVILAFFPSDISQAGKDAAAAQLQQFSEKGLSKCSDVKAVSISWGTENDFPVRDGEEGQKGSLLTAFIGWPSIDAHMKFRETEAFKENAGLISSMDGTIKLAMFHISCRRYEKRAE